MVETGWRWWSQEWADRNPYKVSRLECELVGVFAVCMCLSACAGRLRLG